MRRKDVALRLQESLLNEARRVAEKLSALRTEDLFRERAARGSVAGAKRILRRAGKGKAPVPGDEL